MNPEERKPVESVDFWRGRIESAIREEKMLHQIILDDSHDLWQYINGETIAIIRGHLKHLDRVLDAGCGLGTLVDCLGAARLKVDYTGVDISPDLVALARERYPYYAERFYVANLRHLDYQDGEFDWAVCRSMEAMITHNVGAVAWSIMLTEIKRVARRVILIEYPDTLEEPVLAKVFTSDRTLVTGEVKH